MKRSLLSASILITGVMFLGGCAAAPTEFAPQHKTETEVANITDGMIPQVIEKSVTYVQNESEGEWIVESSEITKWDVASDFDISDSVWAVTTDDATSFSRGSHEDLQDMPCMTLTLRY